MSWLATKKVLKKAHTWCVQHWRWLVFAAVALAAYLTGRKNSRSLWLQAKLAKDQYKREAAAIEKAHEQKSKQLKRAEKKHETSKRSAELEKEKALRKLSEESLKEQDRLSADSDAIDAALKHKGISEV